MNHYHGEHQSVHTLISLELRTSLINDNVWCPCDHSIDIVINSHRIYVGVRHQPHTAAAIPLRAGGAELVDPAAHAFVSIYRY